MPRLFVPLVVFSCALAASPIVAHRVACPVTRQAAFAGLGDLPGGPHWSQVSAVSPDGAVVVGRSAAAPPAAGHQPFVAFVWTEATGMVALVDFEGGAVESHATDVSRDGDVVVGTTDTGAFRWSAAGGLVPLVDASGELFDLTPAAVSADGLVVVGHGRPLTGGTEIFRWTAATGVVNLGALPTDLGVPDGFAFGLSDDGSALVGASLSSLPDVEPVLWTPASGLVGLGDVPGGVFYALGLGISGDGTTLVGNARTAFDSGSRDEAFLWTAQGGFAFLDPERAARFESTAEACSADGSVVVGYSGSTGAMVWDAQSGMRSVRTRLEQHGLDLAGWVLGNVYDVSRDGRVLVGNGTNPSGEAEAWRAVLPRRPPYRERADRTPLAR